MIRIAVLLTFALLVAGCGSLSLYYKEGAAVSRMNSDEAQCDLAAFRAAPVDNRTRIIPGTKEPRQICDAAGNCSTIWVQVTPDRIETYDANEDTRAAFARSCMLSKGYERVSLPACPSEVVERTNLARTTVLPPITGESCAIRLQGGGWQVVNP